MKPPPFCMSCGMRVVNTSRKVRFVRTADHVEWFHPAGPLVHVECGQSVYPEEEWGPANLIELHYKEGIQNAS